MNGKRGSREMIKSFLIFILGIGVAILVVQVYKNPGFKMPGIPSFNFSFNSDKTASHRDLLEKEVNEPHAISRTSEIFLPYVVAIKGEKIFRQRFLNREVRQRKNVTLGSGILLNSQSQIITTYEVVNGFSKVNVQRFDGSNYEGQVILLDSLFSIGIIQIEKQVINKPPLADYKNLEVGQMVAAIGTPNTTLANTVTLGIISAMGRPSLKFPSLNLIQTDASINLGSFGGALVNLYGELVGMTMNDITGSKVNMGVNFALSSQILKKIISDLEKHEAIRMAYTGCLVENLSQGMAEYFKLEHSRGALITEIKEDSPASEADLKSGDVILKINGEEIKGASDFKSWNLLARDEKAEFIIWRGKKEKKIKLKPKFKVSSTLASLQP
jgi:S1-C subfamily serine protease